MMNVSASIPCEKCCVRHFTHSLSCIRNLDLGYVEQNRIEQNRIEQTRLDQTRLDQTRLDLFNVEDAYVGSVCTIVRARGSCLKTLDKLKIQNKIKCQLCICKYKKPSYFFKKLFFGKKILKSLSTCIKNSFEIVFKFLRLVYFKK